MATLLTSVHEVVWVLSQTRAVSHLHALAHNLRPSGLKGHRAIAIHPRIATAATQAGFADVRLIEPSPVALVGALVMMSDGPSAKPISRITP
jgi:uroporphyrinogen-III synthase